jgi:hypothetical protein
MMDDRYDNQTERDKILKNYIKDGRVIIFPSKEKKKLVILQYIVDKFKSDKKYTEKEVNEVIVSMVDDYVSARRYLIELGFMERNNDGSEYWVKDVFTRGK